VKFDAHSQSVFPVPKHSIPFAGPDESYLFHGSVYKIAKVLKSSFSQPSFDGNKAKEI
jgi:hypothetical protein